MPKYVKNTLAYAVRNEVIVQFEGDQYICKVIGDRQFEITAVNTGESENGFTEILSPTKDMISNAVFVTEGAYSVLMVMKNKVE